MGVITMVQAKIRYEEGSYEGEVNQGKVPEGAGVFSYRGDDEHGRMGYEGDWVEGLRQGKGKYTCKAFGGKYEGEYRDDRKEGQGRYDWNNGDWYQGQWKSGLRHGQGLYVWKEKNEKYEGSWVEGVKDGTGKFSYANGDVFTGPYVGGNRHGQGQLVKADGEERNENYKEGKLVNFTVTKPAE